MNDILQKYLSIIIFVSLLLLGAYVTLFFLGVDGHFIILLPEEQWKSIVQTTSDPFARGFAGFLFFLEFLFRRLQPFAAYAAISLFLYLAYVSYTVLKKGQLFIQVQLNAVLIILLFVGSVWLIGTTLFYMTFPGLEQRYLIEPLAEVYKGFDEEQLDALRENFDYQMQRGCLEQDLTRSGPGGAKVYFYSGLCVQKSFFTIVLPPFLFILYFVFVFLSLGKFLLWLLRIQPADRFNEFLICLGLGAAALTMLFWFLALTHGFVQVAVWWLLILIPIGLYKFSLYWIRAAWEWKWTWRFAFFSVTAIVAWFLVSYIALNYLTVVRPFPIGWDDLGRYINGPRQMSAFGQIIPGMDSIKWEYLTSLGFMLFGYDSIFGSTLSQQVNWFAGVMAILAVIGCARMVLGKHSGLLAATFYYTLPMVGHFSFADMKTENALFAYGVLGIISLLLYVKGNVIFPEDDEEAIEDEKAPSHQHGNIRFLTVAGILFAAAFATKPTIILLFFAGGIMLTYGMLGWIAGIGSILLSTAVVVFQDTLNIVAVMNKIGVEVPASMRLVVFMFLCISGIILLVLPFMMANGVLSQKWEELRRYGVSVAMLLIGFFGFSAPWMISNMMVNGRVSLGAALSSPNHITPMLAYRSDQLSPDSPPGSRALPDPPDELALDPSHERCIGTSGSEELDRYWGYRTGIMHYIGLPWRNVMNMDSQGYYLTLSPLILLVPLLLLYPAFWKKRYLRFLFWGTMFYAFVWIFVANGIPWYGIGMFLGFAIFIEAMIKHAPAKDSRMLMGVLFLIAIAMSVSLRYWQMDMQRNLYEFSWGKAIGEVIEEMTIPDYDNVSRAVRDLSTREDRPFLYRMGTFVSYFIPRNIETIVQNDNQLDFFRCLNQEKDHVLTLRRLIALGVHSMIFDTNTATIEKDQNGSLHQKVNEFIDFISDPNVGVITIVNRPDRGLIYIVLPEAPPGELQDSPEEVTL